jgi:AhpD family alkylhydroperoxidase
MPHLTHATLRNTQKEVNVTPRIDYRQFSPDALQAMLALEKHLSSCGFDHKFMHLLKLRASQINGCAYCIDMHSIDARAAGETEQRLYALDAWRETPFFDDRERAALAWIEAVTLVSQTHVPDAVYDEARKHFSEAEMVDLTYLASTINAWNRIAVSLRAVPGRYKARTPAA